MKIVRIKNLLDEIYNFMENTLKEGDAQLLDMIEEYINQSENEDKGELLLQKSLVYLEYVNETNILTYEDIKNYFNNKLIGLSLFSNVAIAETYAEDYVSFRVSNELIKERANFQQEMYPNTKVIQGDILEEDIFDEIMRLAEKANCNFILGSPPCQSMSLSGKREEDHPRNKLIVKVIEAIEILEPKYFLIENVPSMPNTYIIMNNEKIKIKDFIENRLSEKYNININILNAKDFGTPQARKRAFVIGSLKEEKEWLFPTNKQKEITVREAIEHLPSLESEEKSEIKYHFAKKHNERHIRWMKNTPTGKSSHNNKINFPQKEDGTKIKGFSTTYKRIEWDKPAPTITMANGSISSQNNVHPGRENKDGTYSDARVLTLKEIFILTGLPDDWMPPEDASDNLIRNVIGEGIPPRLIEELLKTIPK